MGLYTMMTAGGVPIAALIGGAIGSIFGPAEAVGIAAVVMFSFLAWVLVTRRLRLVRLDVHAEPDRRPRARADGRDRSRPLTPPMTASQSVAGCRYGTTLL